MLEDVIDPVPLQIRSLVLQQIKRKTAEPGGGLRYYVHVWQKLKDRELPEAPQGIHWLSITLGVAFAVLGTLEGQGKLSPLTVSTFVNDVVAMLQGKSQGERAKARVEMALKSTVSKQN